MLAQFGANRHFRLIRAVEAHLLLLLSLDILSDGEAVDLLGIHHLIFGEVYEGPDDPNLLIVGVISLKKAESVNKAEDSINIVFCLLLAN